MNTRGIAARIADADVAETDVAADVEVEAATEPEVEVVVSVRE
jgi:hypothetical protein